MDLAKEALILLKKNRRETDGHSYTVPSPNSYPYQWLWDSCFHAIVLSRLDPVQARQELRSLVSKQFEDGMIPHIIYWQPGDLHKYEWGKEGTSAITQPPIIALAVWRVYEETTDKEFLREMYRPLMAFYHYLIKERDRHGHHMVSIINPDESGEDNSPRFDRSLGITDPLISIDEHLKKRLDLIEDNRTCKFDALHCMEKFFWVKDVPFNAMLVHNLEILAKISAVLDESEAVTFATEEAELISHAMRERMCDGGIFWSVEDIHHQKIKIDTWAHFAPMLAGLYTAEEAKDVVDTYLLNPESFCSPHGIRSVSKREASYNPENFWRGPIWIAVHWFVYKGLKKYGFEKEAKDLKEKTAKLIEKQGFREYYHPETGEGLGAEDFTWGTLLLDMD